MDRSHGVSRGSLKHATAADASAGSLQSRTEARTARSFAVFGLAGRRMRARHKP